MSLHSVLMLPFQHANLAREVLEQFVELLHVFEAADDLGGVEPFEQLLLAVGAQPERKEHVVVVLVTVEVVVVVGGEVAAMACGRWLWKACGCKILQLFCRLSSSVVD